MDLFEQKDIHPMLIYEMKEPFNSEDWIYELKLDGIRCIAYLDNKETDLRNKRNLRLISKFPELKTINERVKDKCILDGELIVLKNSVPDFYEVQRRVMLTDSFKIQLQYSKYPASFVAYDILYYKGKDITELPLMERKQILSNVVNENNHIAVSRYVDEKGIELYQMADQQLLEGVVAKRKESKYYFDKRSKDWIKFKRMSEEDFIICGYKQKENHSSTLILGKYRGDILLYKGSVTFGVKLDFLQEYRPKILNHSPFNLTPIHDNDITWVEPVLVCTVEYMPNTKNTLRQPVYKGIRDDIQAIECQVTT